MIRGYIWEKFIKMIRADFEETKIAHFLFMLDTSKILVIQTIEKPYYKLCEICFKPTYVIVKFFIAFYKSCSCLSNIKTITIIAAYFIHV